MPPAIGKLLCNGRYRLYLDEAPFAQLGHRDYCPRWSVIAEHAGIHRVYLRPQRAVGNVNGHRANAIKAAPSGAENRFDVAKSSFRLLCHIVRRDHRPGRGIERELAGNVDGAILNHPLGIMTGGSRRVGCRDEMHMDVW